MTTSHHSEEAACPPMASRMAPATVLAMVMARHSPMTICGDAACCANAHWQGRRSRMAETQRPRQTETLSGLSHDT